MIKQVIGVIPQSCGDFNPERPGGYDKAERVFLFGCEWESKVDGNTYVPAVKDSEGRIIPDEVHWYHCSGSIDSNEDATHEHHGLMSAEDKIKLDEIEAGAQKHMAPTSDEVKSALGTGSGTEKFLREDGTWQPVSQEQPLLPDEEDLTAVGSVVKLKDRPNTDGMGRVILRRNMVLGVNTLTQSMIDKTNTIYVIQYDFTLGEDITVPAGSMLEFEGGSILGNKTLTGSNTCINAEITKIFGSDATFAGSWNVAVSYPEWFDISDAAKTRNAIQKAVNIADSVVLSGDYNVQNSVYNPDEDMYVQRQRIIAGTVTEDYITVGSGKTVEITGKVKAVSPLTDLFRIEGNSILFCGGGIIEGCGVVNDTNSSDPAVQWEASLIAVNGSSNTISGLKLYQQTTNGIRIKTESYNNHINGCMFGGGLAEHGTGTDLNFIFNNGYMTVVECNRFVPYEGKKAYQALFSAYQNDSTQIPYVFRENTVIEGAMDHAVYAYGNTGGRIENNYIKDTNAIPLQLFSKSNIITGNIIEWTQDSDIYDPVKNPNGITAIKTMKGGHIISDNLFKGVTKNGISISDDGISASVSGDAESTRIMNNRFEIRYGLYSFTSGINISGTYQGVVKDLVICGNSFIGTDLTMNCYSSAIDIISDNDGTDVCFEGINISGNSFGNIRQSPIRILMSGRESSDNYGFVNITISNNVVGETFANTDGAFIDTGLFTISHGRNINIHGNNYYSVNKYSQGYPSFISLKCCSDVVVKGNCFKTNDDSSLRSYILYDGRVSNLVYDSNIFYVPQKGVGKLSSGQTTIAIDAPISYANSNPEVYVKITPLNKAAVELQKSENYAYVEYIMSSYGAFYLKADAAVSEECLFEWEVVFKNNE